MDVATLCLAVLAHGPASGYEIKKELEGGAYAHFFRASFGSIYPALARQFGAELYPFFLDGVITRPELLLADGMHPNARGIEAVVARVVPLVRAELVEQADDRVRPAAVPRSSP